MSDSPSEADPHFIGWLPIPRAYARFLAPVAVGLLAGAVVAAGLLAAGQRSPGPGRWEDEVTVYEGVAFAEPYAVVRVRDEASGSPVTVLLVEEGKHGAKDRVRSFDGRAVRVSGTLLHRDGRRMLELFPGDAGILGVEMSAERANRLRNVAPTARGPVTLAGEIVDSKCYLGAMKPADGRTHKGCAVLCLRGGVPPLLAVRGPDGRTAYHLLTGPDGGPLDPAVFEHVGEPVEVSGELEQRGDLSVLKAAPDGVRRR